MFENFFYIFNKKNKLIQNINLQILRQSRKKDLYIYFNIEDNFQNRLNFQILHLSLILLNLNFHENKYYFKKNILKSFLNNFDLDFREKGLGDKLIEKNIFEISNLVNYQLIQYDKCLSNKKILRTFLKKFFIFYKLDNKIKLLENYINKQTIHLQKLSLNTVLNTKIFLE